MDQNANQLKYGWIKAGKFTLDQRNYFCRIIIQKYIQCLMKENLLLLEDSLEPKKIKNFNE